MRVIYPETVYAATDAARPYLIFKREDNGMLTRSFKKNTPLGIINRFNEAMKVKAEYDEKAR